MVVRSFDDFLIDRVFQPLADRLDVIASCHAIAAWLMTGCGLLQIFALAWMATHGASVIFIVVFGAVQGLWIPRKILEAQSDARRPYRLGLLPMTRLYELRIRMLFILAIAVWHMLDLLPGRPDDAKDYAIVGGWWLMVVGMYFNACRRAPPAQQSRVTNRTMRLGLQAQRP